ncbi:hypothetical protein ABZ589_18495 [Streptomyces sp. NPDC013313]|uniref:hypothetical protein n=1 Tax=Streptomyces sp. NPDC013313 TaxID=3155603 RepID=UPI003402A89B
MTREARSILERLPERLFLTDREISRLAPSVVPWLREDHSRNEILKCLTEATPAQVDSVAGLIPWRLKNFTPEHTPSAAVPVPRPATPVRVE